MAHVHGHNVISGNNTINQNTNMPGIDLDRDIIRTELEGEVLLGMDLPELAVKQFRINIATILVSALIFLIILAWFDFIQTTFYNYLYPPSIDDAIPSSVKLWYAIGITIFITLVIILIYYHTL